MIIYRKYCKDDYQDIKNLVETNGYDFFPENLGGISIVAEDDGEPVGYVWALVSKKSDNAYIDYFVVESDHRDKREVGPLLMSHLFCLLDRAGIKRVSGVLIKGTGYDVSLCNVYNDVGMKVTPASYYISGDVRVILSGIIRRYHLNNGVENVQRH